MFWMPSHRSMLLDEPWAMNAKERFPSVAHMQAAAKKRLPKFAYDYLAGGIGRETALETNRRALDEIKLMPRYLCDNADAPDCSRELLGRTYAAPFGVAPIGLSGLMWPRAPEHLARAARSHNIPFTLSGFATTSMEDIATIAGSHAWYQHYVTVDDDINRSMLKSARDAGYEVLIITVDIPTATRRDRDIINGVSIPPRMDARTILSAAVRPRWSWQTLRAGLPRFRNLLPYMPTGASLDQAAVFVTELIEGHVSLDRLQRLREMWPGKFIVKGILDAEEARQCSRIGVDAIVVSNHGGRQLDAAPSALHVLSDIRQAVGTDIPLLADGGARNGLDILRFLACGADFVLLGRAFMYGVAAMGAPGADHVMKILKQEFRMSMGQLGCGAVKDLPDFLA